MAKIIDNELLERLQQKAKESERLRTHYLLHESPEAPVHRFCIIAEPGTQVTPHRHPGKWEMTVMLRGEIELQTFDEKGNIIKAYALSPNKISVIELDEYTYHRFVAKTSAAFMEIKPGPLQEPEQAPFVKAESK